MSQFCSAPVPRLGESDAQCCAEISTMSLLELLELLGIAVTLVNLELLD